MLSAGRSVFPRQGLRVAQPLGSGPAVTALTTRGPWETKGTPKVQVCKGQAMPPAPSGARNQNLPHLPECREVWNCRRVFVGLVCLSFGGFGGMWVCVFGLVLGKEEVVLFWDF